MRTKSHALRWQGCQMVGCGIYFMPCFVLPSFAAHKKADSTQRKSYSQFRMRPTRALPFRLILFIPSSSPDSFRKKKRRRKKCRKRFRWNGQPWWLYLAHVNKWKMSNDGKCGQSKPTLTGDLHYIHAVGSLRGGQKISHATKYTKHKLIFD